MSGRGCRGQSIYKYLRDGGIFPETLPIPQTVRAGPQYLARKLGALRFSDFGLDFPASFAFRAKIPPDLVKKAKS